MPVTITRLRLGTVPVLAGGVRCCHPDRSKPWMGIAMAPLFGDPCRARLKISTTRPLRVRGRARPASRRDRSPRFRSRRADQGRACLRVRGAKKARFCCAFVRVCGLGAGRREFFLKGIELRPVGLQLVIEFRDLLSNELDLSRVRIRLAL
jgi:hypothetical protein